MTTPIETLVAAMRALANDIESEDGVANAVIAEAAQRLEEQQERIKRLEDAGDAMDEWMSSDWTEDEKQFQEQWRKAKEAKP
jgi:hypothetical protein